MDIEGKAKRRKDVGNDIIYYCIGRILHNNQKETALSYDGNGVIICSDVVEYDGHWTCSKPCTH